MTKKGIPLGALSSLIFVGCASLSSFQDARTVEKGGGRMVLGATHYKADSTKFVDPHDAIYVFDIGARLGVGEKVDLGLRYTIPGAVTADVKYMFTDRQSGLGFSAGFRAAYMNFDLEATDTAGNTTAKATSPTIIDVTLPLYVSYYPLQWLSLTVSPDATYRTVIKAYMTAGPIFGVNGNLKLGENGGLLFEGGWHKAMETGGPSFVTYSAAVFFPFSISLEKMFKEASGNF